MIRIILKKDEIQVKGHADYADYGKDIVCASVSSIVITTVNAILRFDAEALTYEAKSGLIRIVIKKHSDFGDLLILNMTELLKELEKKYQKNIKINEEVL